jgi:hypothetical protein
MGAAFSECMLVAQHRPHVTQFFSQADGSWVYSEFNDLSAKLRLASLDCKLPLSEIFSGVQFDAGAANRSAAPVSS